MPSTFDHWMNPFAVDSVACALERLAFVVQLLFAFSIRPDSGVPGHEFRGPIDVLLVPHVLSGIFFVNKVIYCQWIRGTTEMKIYSP